MVKMYIQSDFMQEQEDRRKKSWVMPVLTAGTLLAGGAAALSLGQKSKIQPNAELVKKGVDDAKKAIKDLQTKNYKSGVTSVGKDKSRLERRRQLLAEAATGSSNAVKVINDKNKKGQYSLNPLPGSKRNPGGKLTPNRAINNRELVEKARDLAKQRGLEYMKYTTTADFAMAGTLGGGIKTGVLSRITGQLGSTVNKAKNWLQKAEQTKQKIGSAAQAKQRLKPQAYVSPNAGAEAIARKKYGTVGVEIAPPLQSTIGKRTSDLDKSLKMRENAGLRTTLTQGSARQINRGSADRFSKSGSKASIADNRSLRVKYTKDPRTGKLVGAAYSKLSLLCDL